jgi:hypothetical protein
MFRQQSYLIGIRWAILLITVRSVAMRLIGRIQNNRQDRSRLHHSKQLHTPSYRSSWSLTGTPDQDYSVHKSRHGKPISIKQYWGSIDHDEFEAVAKTHYQ